MEPFIALALIALAFVLGVALDRLVIAPKQAQDRRVDADVAQAIAAHAAESAISDFARRGAAASNAKQRARREAERKKVLETAAQMRAGIEAASEKAGSPA